MRGEHFGHSVYQGPVRPKFWLNSFYLLTSLGLGGYRQLATTKLALPQGRLL